MPDWTSFLSAMTLCLVRVSGMVAFAPFFSSTALPVRVKAVFVGAIAFLLAPLVASLPNAAHTDDQLCGSSWGTGGGAGLWPLAHVADRDAPVCRTDCGSAVQLFAGQPPGPLLGNSDTAARGPVSADGHAGCDHLRPRPYPAGLGRAQLPRSAAGHVCSVGPGWPR